MFDPDEGLRCPSVVFVHHCQWLNGGTGGIEVKCHVPDEAEHPLSDRFRGTLLFRNAIRQPYSE
jgi:hypothetical protein